LQAAFGVAFHHDGSGIRPKLEFPSRRNTRNDMSEATPPAAPAKKPSGPKVKSAKAAATKAAAKPKR